MSTWMYLKCINHDPPILADEESGQHHYDLPRIREEIANRADLVRRLTDGDLPYDNSSHYGNYFPRNSARFLRHHPHCEIRIESEYGIDETDTPAPSPQTHEREQP